MKATIETQGSQFTVEQGDKLFVNRFPESTEGDVIDIDKVLMLIDDGKPSFGAPFVEGASVKVKILENKRAKKVIISAPGKGDVKTVVQTPQRASSTDFSD